MVLLHSGARLHVHPLSVDAWKARDLVMSHHGYHPRKADTGSYNCRKITGGSGYSLHAYKIAADFNWQTNPYSRRLITDMPFAMVLDILAIRTVSGNEVFIWGGDWDANPVTAHKVYDAMHYQLACSRTEVGSGIAWETVAGSSSGGGSRKPPRADPKQRPHQKPRGGFVTVKIEMRLLAVGDKGDDVRPLQRVLKEHADQTVLIDGAFGPVTLEAVENLQSLFGLEVDGVVGAATWAAVFGTATPP